MALSYGNPRDRDIGTDAAAEPLRLLLSQRRVARREVRTACGRSHATANYPPGSTPPSSLAHGSSFCHLGYSGAAVIPEAGAVGPVPRTTASPVRFGILMGRAYPGCPETAWDSHRSVWSAIVSRRNHQAPCRAAATNRNVCREERRTTLRCFSRLRSVAPRLGPKRDSSRTGPCLAPPSANIADRSWLRTFPCGKFEHGLPHGYGPARVGLDRSV